jgi:tetratricopeptide (TPR) repeat protein
MEAVSRSSRRPVFAPPILALLATALAGCGGTPWFLGAPLDGHPSIPPRSRVVTVAEHHQNAALAFASGDRVVEIAELEALEQRDSLREAERGRLVSLLLARAADWVALQRPIPLEADLRNVIALAPGRRLALMRPLRRAERGAGDAWLAMGQNARAEEAYRRAERDGMGGMTYRLRAVWGAVVGDLELATLEEALTQLPERVLAPFSDAYLAAGGSQPTVLARARQAARVFGPPALLDRLDAVAPVPSTEAADAGVGAGAGAPAGAAPPPASSASAGGAPALTPGAPPPGSPAPALTPTPSPSPVPSPSIAGGPPGPLPSTPDLWRALYGGPTLARRLIPAARLHPELLEPSPASRDFVVHLLDEDPTSPDSLELAAIIEARAGRVDSAASKLEDLVFYSGDKVEGASRAAGVWQRVGQRRRACAAWEQAALAGAIDDPHWCRFLACAAATPGATNLPEARRFVSARAPHLACADAPAPGTLPGASVPPASTAAAPE